jgi:hypothetical protein
MHVPFAEVLGLVAGAVTRNPKAGMAARFAQLATLNLDGTPTVRTVVLRGFVDSGAPPPPSAHTADNAAGAHGASDRLWVKFVTDRRSQKVLQVQRASAVEVCWYLPDSWEQFRMKGHMLVGGAACVWLRLLRVASCWLGLLFAFFVRGHACVYACLCVRVRVCVRESECVCVGGCVGVCERLPVHSASVDLLAFSARSPTFLGSTTDALQGH